MHVAIPRIMDFHANQSLQQSVQKTNQDQEQMVNNVIETNDQMMHKSTGVENTQGELIRDGQEKNQYTGQRKKKKKKNDTDEIKIKNEDKSHPYIGQHIDFKA